MPQPTTSAKRRKRLIDTLVALKESSSEGEEEESQCQDDPAVSHHSESSLASFDLGPAAGLPAATPAKVTAVVRAMSGATKPGPRITYGMARTTVLEEEDVIMGGLDFGALANASSTKAPLLSLARPKPPPNAFSFEDDEDTANTGQVRSIHELRQAGATNRYADEMADFEDRVGVPSAKPSSIRRGALLEIAERMHEKEFRKQFRMHGSKIFFERLAQETDIVAAYAIVAILTTLFGTQSSAHLIQQTAFHGIAELLALLLHRPEHVRSIARDRKNNLSKNAQKSMNELEEAVLKLPIWRPATPTLLSPRTLALKCLELMMRQCTDARIETKIFSAAVTDHLFSVLTQAVSDASFWDFPTRHQSTDLYLALVLLEPLSLGAMQSELGPTWTAEYVPIVADVLKTALDRPVDKFDELENLVLRLVLNSTNNNTSACGMFVRKGLLRRLTETACRSFQSVLTSIKDDAFMAKVLESLVFMLGVLINFCEHYPPAAQDLADATTESESGDQPPVHRLIRVFLDYYSKTSDADSMEKSQLNVAFGYLSVALGYLCLHRDVRDAFESVHSKRTLAPLVDAVREFMRYHQLLAANAMDAGHAEEARQHSPATQRLERLVGQLEQCH
ncbi:hypothetical protein P8C59_006616 [Phyllachora maydis]|uniref:Wings apart-like protein C-terminal domain-containing protein n=1 Tax=Phyllachora maydis TaxID=1825666 RepID=A0AAD9I6U3_9PEZI|nr:hypothetical protein P8C59_006616 [Phyllachora maydis]